MSEKPSSERLVVDADDAITEVFQRLNQVQKELEVAQSRLAEAQAELARYEAAEKGAHDRAIGVEMNGATWVDKEYYDALRAAYAAIKAGNESLRAECGLRQIAGYAKGKCDQDATIDALKAQLATARASEREKVLPLLKRIARGPIMPLPDPHAHSWQAFGTRAHSALCDCMSLANEAIRTLDDAPEHATGQVMQGSNGADAIPDAAEHQTRPSRGAEAHRKHIR